MDLLRPQCSQLHGCLFCHMLPFWSFFSVSWFAAISFLSLHSFVFYWLARPFLLFWSVFSLHCLSYFFFFQLFVTSFFYRLVCCHFFFVFLFHPLPIFWLFCSLVFSLKCTITMKYTVFSMKYLYFNQPYNNDNTSWGRCSLLKINN